MIYTTRMTLTDKVLIKNSDTKNFTILQSSKTGKINLWYKMPKICFCWVEVVSVRKYTNTVSLQG